MEPVSFRELIAATGGKPFGFGNLDEKFERVSIDSRTLRPGDLFWAIVGDKHDGHNYLDDVHRKSAVAAVVHDSSARLTDIPVILVDDTLLAFWDFAEWYRQQFDSLVVAVTGSVGKTTTRSMLHATLSARFNGIQSIGNFNNQYGVPLSLLQLGPAQEFAVLEVAASRREEIADLASIIHPEVGVITAIAPTHLDTFGTIENIARTKGELLEAIPESGFAVLNGDDDLIRELASRANCRVIFVGERRGNDLVAEWVKVENGWLRFSIDRSEFDIPVIGRHHLTAAMVSVAVGREVDMTDEEIATGLRMFDPAPGRCRLTRVGPWTVIDDTYNASPASAAAACRALQDWETSTKKILVMGDMLALGNQSKEYHAELGKLIASSGLSQVIAVGTQAATVAGTARHHGMDAGCLGACRDLDTVQLLLDMWLEPGDVLLIKGSRETKMEQVIQLLEKMQLKHRDPGQETTRRVA